MYTYLIQASICLIILYGIYHFVLSELTFFRHNRVYLIGAIILSLLVPAIAPYIVMSQEQIPVVHWSYIAAEMESVYVQYDEGFDYTMWMWALLGVIYFTGVSVVLARMIFGLSKIYNYFLSGEKEVKNGFNIITTDSVHLPFSFFKSVYISRHIPLSDHVQTILDHEEIHIKHWHTVDVLFAEAIQAFFWFNPVMIFYKRALRQAHEYLADDIICSKNSVSSYMELLLSKSESGMELALTNQFFHSQIKKRIEMMTKHKTNRHAAWKYALVLPLLMGLVVVFSCREKETNAGVKKEVKGDVKGEATQLKEGYYYTDQEMENVYQVAQSMPRFPGCENLSEEKVKEECAKNLMLEFIYNNLKYPANARQKGIQGQCIAQFIVTDNGIIENIKIVRDIGGGCGEEVKRTIALMNNMPNKWEPGIQDGKPVKVLYTLPVKFKLEDEGNKKESIGKVAEPLDLLKKLLTREFGERPMLVVDGEEKDSYYLSHKSFVSADEVTVISKEDAIKKYGEKAKYGCVEIKNPKFDFKKKFEDMWEVEIFPKMGNIFGDSVYSNPEKLEKYKNSTLGLIEKYYNEAQSKKVHVPLFKLENGDIVEIPDFEKIEKGDILVSGNGIPLKEDEDYVVNYEKGTMQVINYFVLKGRQSINVSSKK